jgi:hypothetical protein
MDVQVVLKPPTARVDVEVVGWESRDWAKWTGEQRRDFYGGSVRREDAERGRGRSAP